MPQNTLDGLLNPGSIALVGASTNPGKIGYTVLQNIIESKFQGEVYPINPTAPEILGLKAYPTIEAVPGEIDAAIIAVPAKYVVQVAEECGRKGVKGLIVIASGFSEMGNRELENELVLTARRYGTRILGPNIVGTLTNSNDLNASFAPFLPLPGKATLISQSGALLVAMGASTYTRQVGFDKLISIGNMSDVNFAEIIDWLDEDEHTGCISLYVEGFSDGRSFIEAGKRAKKPIIALKSGTSAHGAAAAVSHTGSMAGAAKVYSAAFQQAGIINASDLNNLFDRTLALSLQPPMRGDNLMVVTNGGGVGVLASDAADRYGIPLHFAPEEVQAELKNYMPEYGSAKNPADLTGMGGEEEYYQSVRCAYSHEWVDGLVVLICEVPMFEPMDIAKGIKRAVIDSGITDKPVVVSIIGGKKSQEAMDWLLKQGIPTYFAPDTAVNAMAALRDFDRMRQIRSGDLAPIEGVGEAAARHVIQQARADGRDSLTECEAKQVFSAYQLPVASTQLATNEDEAISMAEEIGYPIVMKITSPDILHKTDAGGVVVNIKNEAAARAAYQQIIANAWEYNPKADIHGVVIQEMAPYGTEVIIGSINDPTFGPTVMFGLGGIFVEVLKDVTFRIAPITSGQAEKMLDEIRGAPVLAGVRGEHPRDRTALAGVLSRYSQMILDLADEISETDANPILVYAEGRGVKIVDARIVLK